MDYSNRQNKLRIELSRYPLDAILVSYLPNVRYLTGFTGSNGMLLLGHRDALFFTDSRYRGQAKQEVTAEVIVVEGALEYAALTAVGDLGAVRIGFESARISQRLFSFVSSALGPPVEWLATENLVEGLRAVKEPEETVALRRAIELTARVFDQFLPQVRAGRRERELAAILEFELRRSGAEKMSFDTIVASGARAALPHGIASEKELAAGEFVVFDFGIVLNGYCSDMTRTVFVGQPSQRAREIYDLVLEAQTHCETQLRAGMTCQAADALTREVIARGGYSEYYQHSTGHGIGLEVHELPRISKLADGVVASGAVVTVEPGIYLPDWGGVRIEDMVLVTEAGAQILTPGSKELVALPG